MGFADFFNFGASGSLAPLEELPDIYPMPVSQTDFVTADIVTIYSKILTDTLERTQGLSDDQTRLMWDNCLKSEKADGLVTMLSKAMADRKDLFLVYEKLVNVIRVATSEEQEKIRQDYATSAKSATGVFISFKNFQRSDMVKFYLILQYATVGSLYKSMNLSKAIQIKINDLRKSVSLTDAAGAKTQAKAIADALACGKDVYCDAKDVIETAVPELEATQQASALVVQKQSFYLGMPASYISGEQTTGIGSTGEGDMRAVERGLKNYFFSIVQPVCDAIFGVKVTYKSQDFRQIESGMDVLKIFSLTDDVLVSQENKRKILNSIFGLAEDAKGDAAPKPAPVAVPPPKPGAPQPSA